MIVAINGNRHQENHLDQIERLVDSLIRRDDTVVMTDRFLAYLEEKIGPRFALGIHHIPLSETPQADLAIAIGGDGAFLKTAAWVGDSGIPVAGINTGHLGFMAAFSFDRARLIYENLMTGDYLVEPRSVIELEVTGADPAASEGKASPKPAAKYYALNEVAITRGEHASMVTVETDINSHHSLTYKGDGLIISTPTGSTAYNLSVGGPILDPELEAWVLSPIAAHSLSARPLVISDRSTLRLRVNLRASCYNLAIDGKSLSLSASMELTLRRAPFSVNVVSLPSHPFTDTLRSKLGLGL